MIIPCRSPHFNKKYVLLTLFAEIFRADVFWRKRRFCPRLVLILKVSLWYNSLNMGRYSISEREAAKTEKLQDLIIIGAGGLGRDTAWLVRRINRVCPTWRLLGFLDDSAEMQGKVFNGDPVLGTLEQLTEYPDAFVVCAIAAARVRRRIIARVLELVPSVRFATLIDPSAELSDTVEVGAGSIICAHTIATVNIRMGAHVIINANCTVGHDAVLHDYVTVYPGVNISGTTEIGTCAELGTGMQIIQGKKIGDETIIGAGAVVIRDLPPKCTAVGCPAKPIRFRE